MRIKRRRVKLSKHQNSIKAKLRQLEIGMSTNLYFPAMGTAGLERLSVRGNNLLPLPPPNTIDITLGFIYFVVLF